MNQTSFKKTVYSKQSYSLTPYQSGAFSKSSSSSSYLSEAHFYSLIGIQKPPAFDDAHLDPPLRMRKDGLYSIIDSKEWWTNVKYHTFAVGVYILLGAQLLLSAVFVILGSLHNVDSHLTIAILGAVGTIIAGTLAFMKGQGQPDRLRRTRNGLRDVKLHAKRLYLSVGGGNSATQADVDKLWEEYIVIIKMEEMNHPDTPVGLPAITSPATTGTIPTVSGVNLTPGKSTHNF